MSDRTKNLDDKILAERLGILGKRLKQYRTNARLSQMDLGFEAGVSQNMISLIESGKKNSTLSVLFKLSDTLGISPSMLLEDEEASSKAAFEAKKADIISLIQKL